MKTLNIHTAIILLFVIFFSSCEKNYNIIEGDGPVTSKSLLISDINSIEMATACNVVISQGPNQEVRAVGHLNIIDRLKLNVNDNTWKIDLEKGTYKDYELTVYITLPDIEKVSLSGAGDITINDFSNQENLSLDISGVGKIDLYSFNGSGNLNIRIDGSGTVTGNRDLNNFKKLDISIHGAGNYFGFPIQTDNCTINIPGAGSCYVSVRNSLDVTIKGSGSIFYKGFPTVKQNINAAGSIVENN